MFHERFSLTNSLINLQVRIRHRRDPRVDAQDHDHTGLGGGLTGDLGVGVLGQPSVEDGIRDLVTDLVCKWVSG